MKIKGNIVKGEMLVYDIVQQIFLTFKMDIEKMHNVTDIRVMIATGDRSTWDATYDLNDLIPIPIVEKEFRNGKRYFTNMLMAMKINKQIWGM